MSSQRQRTEPTRLSSGEAPEEEFTADTGPNVELHARNLHNPSHMDWTDDGRLLVSEHTAGRVMDITDGGNMKDAEPFAEGLEGPASQVILEDGRVLVAETWGGRVTDVTDGGDMSDSEPFAGGLCKPYSIESISYVGDEERVYVTEDYLGVENWISDVTGGGHADDGDFEVVFDEFPVSAGAPGNTPLAANERTGEYEDQWEQFASANCGGGWTVSADSGDRLFAKGSHVGQVLEITGDEGSAYYDIIRDGGIKARGLSHVGGIYVNSDDGLLYGTEPYEGRVFAVDPDRKGNYRFTPPVVTGLIHPTCVRFGSDGGGDEMYVCSRGEGCVWKITDWR